MSGAVVNLNRARKVKAKADDKADAAQNRLKFGRTKAEKTLAERRAEMEALRLDRHRRDGD